MTIGDEKQLPISETSPLNSSNLEEDYEEVSSSSSYGCGTCLTGLCFWRQGNDNSITSGRYLLPNNQQEENWALRKLKSVKEMSEIIAGPKWKNFIRSFSKKKKASLQQFQYDPHSYALNFDDGINRDDDYDNENDEQDSRVPFSARFPTQH
ncbi:hypothetical protein ACFE04_018199 [Oxalis oulophora]